MFLDSDTGLGQFFLQERWRQDKDFDDTLGIGHGAGSSLTGAHAVRFGSSIRLFGIGRTVGYGCYRAGLYLFRCGTSSWWRQLLRGQLGQGIETGRVGSRSASRGIHSSQQCLGCSELFGVALMEQYYYFARTAHVDGWESNAGWRFKVKRHSMTLTFST